jgi:hypothetical protein
MTDHTEMAHQQAELTDDLLSKLWSTHDNWLELCRAIEALVRADERKKIADWYNRTDGGSTWSWVVEEKIRTGGYLND